MRKYFGENIFENGPGDQEKMSFNDFSIFSPGGHFVWLSGTVSAILL